MSRNIELPHRGWKPRGYQLEAWRALRDPTYKEFLLAWHRRAGKDELALHDTAIRLVQRTGNYWHMLPEYAQARKAIWETVNSQGLKRWEQAFPKELISHVDNQTMKLTFHNGSTWQVLGSDNYNSLVGSAPVHIVMSEAALADPNAFVFFSPILAENNGTSLHISSVRGRNHFYEQFKLAEKDPHSFAQHLSAEHTGVFTPEALARERHRLIALHGEAVGDSFFRQEYLSDWDASNVGAVWGKELRLLRAEGRALPLRHDTRYPVMTFWDIGVADETVILFMQEVGNTIRIIDWYAGTDIGLDAYAEVIHSKPYLYLGHFAPHDIANREWTTGLSRMEEALKMGIRFERVDKTRKDEQIAAASHLLKRTEINVIDKEGKEIGDDCEFILDALGEYKFKYDKERRVMHKTPEHNWASHYADAYMTAAVALQQRRGSPIRRAAAGRTVSTMRLADIIHAQNKQSNRVGDAWGS